VCLVAALLAAKIDLGVATAWFAGRMTVRASLLLRTEALHAAPRLDQRAIDREMIVRQKTPHLRSGQDR
jgi:hypothetical protein